MAPLRPFLFALVALTGCTTLMPREYLPPPLSNPGEEGPVKTVTIPLPTVEADPNEGNTYGGLVAVLLHNARDEISTILAPQVNVNRYFGTTVTLYGAFYPSPDRSWEFNLSRSERVNRDYELSFRDGTLLGRALEVGGSARDSANGSARFFGFHADSSPEQETNFTARRQELKAWISYRWADGLSVSLGERLRRVRVGTGVVSSLPFITELFRPEDVPGLDGFTAHAQRLALTYSTLDSPNMPTRGVLGTLSVEGSWKALGSSATYLRYGAEAKGFFPGGDGRFITAARLAFTQVEGRDVPFPERSALGGENTLRGFGTNRFIDAGSVLFNVEERVRLFRWTVFGVDADWEVAPFLDVGTVMEDPAHLRLRDLQYVPGTGFRALVRPNVVGHVDFGWGGEGLAVFISLDYPF